jgi:hypothetical protein
MQPNLLEPEDREGRELENSIFPLSPNFLFQIFQIVAGSKRGWRWRCAA